MAKKQSAGLLLFRLKNKLSELFLVHPGGPFWKNKDAGAWSIPKGEHAGDEDALEAAKREFFEETGMRFEGEFIELAPIKQAGGKTIYAWALEADLDPGEIKSNEFEMEWPPRSGKKQSFPEIDRGAWFLVDKAKEKINKGQVGLIEDLLRRLNTIEHG